jgi:hypothetical protein
MIKPQRLPDSISPHISMATSATTPAWILGEGAMAQYSLEESSCFWQCKVFPRSTPIHSETLALAILGWVQMGCIEF